MEEIINRLQSHSFYVISGCYCRQWCGGKILDDSEILQRNFYCRIQEDNRGGLSGEENLVKSIAI